MERGTRTKSAQFTYVRERYSAPTIASSANKPIGDRSGAFALTALLLGMIGIYGVLSYSVDQWTQEIGVRMAMGAARGQVVRLVLRGGMTWAGGGIALGLVGAVGVSSVLANLLFEIPAQDPVTLAVAGTTLALVALGACYVPAARATRINPTVALRSE